MSRTIALMALIFMAAGATSSRADPTDNVKAAFGNTIVSTYPDGRQGKLWLKEDGAYTGEGRRHDPSSGTWKIKGDQICLRQRKPPTLPISYCTAIPAGGVGSTWRAKALTGDPLKVELVAGAKN